MGENDTQETSENNTNLEVASVHKVFVAGLPWSLEEKTLHTDFSECGKIVDITFLTEKETGRSRGVAFITFEDDASVQAALKYDGDMYAGRPLEVQIANSKGKSKEGKGKQSDRRVSIKPPGCKSV